MNQSEQFKAAADIEAETHLLSRGEAFFQSLQSQLTQANEAAEQLRREALASEMARAVVADLRGIVESFGLADKLTAALAERDELRQELEEAKAACFMPAGYGSSLAEFITREVWPVSKTEDVETVAELRKVIQAALSFIENMRCPQTIADVGLLLIKGKPVMDSLTAALARKASEPITP